MDGPSGGRVRFASGVVEPAEEIARVLRSADWATSRTTDQIRQALAATQVVATAWDSAACVGVMRILSDGVFRALVEDVVVDPARRNEGIGRALVE